MNRVDLWWWWGVDDNKLVDGGCGANDVGLLCARSE